MPIRAAALSGETQIEWDNGYEGHGIVMPGPWPSRSDAARLMQLGFNVVEKECVTEGSGVYRHWVRIYW